ncbi:hypothetical protein FB451DRAFT_1511489 [Mycena latifolia]|nr:hypothetical protein FB451DRAFT_1511489 [Mycena latifolia]
MFFLFSLLPLFYFFFTTQAALVNVTIDDTAGDSLTGALVTYTPSDAWNSQNECIDCLVHPDTTKLQNGTWHDSTFSVDGVNNPHRNVPLTASASFNGSAVYVFCALARSSTNPDGNSDMTFYLDGVVVGSFTQFAVGSTGFDYHVPVYINTNVPPGRHTLTIQNGHQNGRQSLLVLDSIVYSYDDGQPEAAQASGQPAAAAATSTGRGASLAVAGVLIFVLVVLLVGIGIFLYRRRSRRRAIYARYMPKGAVQAFPSFLAPSPVSTPGLAPLPPVYAGGRAGTGAPPASPNWWAGRDKKSRDGTLGIGPHRPYADLDPSQARLQRPQGWEHTAAVV